MILYNGSLAANYQDPQAKCNKNIVVEPFCQQTLNTESAILNDYI